MMPWNEADRAKYDVIRAHYSSDMSEAEFALIARNYPPSIAWAVSNLKCNTRPLDFIVEHFLGSSESEACAWPRVEAGGDFFEIAV